MYNLLGAPLKELLVVFCTINIYIYFNIQCWFTVARSQKSSVSIQQQLGLLGSRLPRRRGKCRQSRQAILESLLWLVSTFPFIQGNPGRAVATVKPGLRPRLSCSEHGGGVGMFQSALIHVQSLDVFPGMFSCCLRS